MITKSSYLLKLKKLKYSNKNFFFFNKKRVNVGFSRQNLISFNTSRYLSSKYFHVFFLKPILFPKPKKNKNKEISSLDTKNLVIFQTNIIKTTHNFWKHSIDSPINLGKVFRIESLTLPKTKKKTSSVYNLLSSFFFKRKLLYNSIGSRKNLIKLDRQRLISSDSFFSDTDSKSFIKLLNTSNVSNYINFMDSDFLNNLFHIKYNSLLNDRMFYKFFFLRYSLNFFWDKDVYLVQNYVNSFFHKNYKVILKKKSLANCHKHFFLKKPRLLRFKKLFSKLSLSNQAYLRNKHLLVLDREKVRLFKKTRYYSLVLSNSKRNKFRSTLLRFYTNNNIFPYEATAGNYKFMYSGGYGLTTPVLNFFNLNSTRLHYPTMNNNIYTYLLFIFNPLFLKTLFNNSRRGCINSALKPFFSFNNLDFPRGSRSLDSNIYPSEFFKKVFIKKAFSYYSAQKFQLNVIPWYYHTLVRFLENASGNKVLVQFYPFLNQSVSVEWRIRYNLWLSRFRSYERMLGHKFFLEESIHIVHLSFLLKDSNLFSSWLKTMILRISFWKTRSIFRFIKYLMISHFYYIFKELGVKGLKIKLKGKISVAGNSRKRTILYRIGKTSNSEVSLKTDYTKTNIHTFTGVMGFHVWIFY